MIAADAESRPGAIPATGNTNNTKCHFRIPAVDFVERWCACGPTHHLALGIGKHLSELALFSQMSSIPLLKPLDL